LAIPHNRTRRPRRNLRAHRIADRRSTRDRTNPSRSNPSPIRFHRVCCDGSDDATVFKSKMDSAGRIARVPAFAAAIEDRANDSRLTPARVTGSESGIYYESKLEDSYRYDFHAVLLAWLECGNGLPLRTPPAGLIGFANAFCNEAKAGSPRAAAIAKEFRAHARPQPFLHARLSDLPRPVGSGSVIAIPRRGRTSGAVRTVEGEHVLETLTSKPPKAGTRIYAVCRMRARILSGQPAMFAAATRSCIRARERGRHENRNDKTLFLFTPPLQTAAYRQYSIHKNSNKIQKNRN